MEAIMIYVVGTMTDAFGRTSDRTRTEEIAHVSCSGARFFPEKQQA